MWLRRIFRPVDSSSLAADSSPQPGEGLVKIYLPPQAFSQLNRLRLNASRYLPGMATGSRPSLRRKPAFDFREHRTYVPGDDIRYVDWKASARQEHIFVKQGEQPKEATVYLLLDCSASMRWGEPPKHAKALQFVAALGYLALAQGDRLVVQPLSSLAVQHLGPISGKGQVPALLNYLRSLSFQGGCDLILSIRQLTQRARGGLILIISDLLESNDLAKALELLPAPAWDVVVFHLLHPQELRPALQGDFQMIDAESDKKTNYDVDAKALQIYRQRIDAWSNDLEMICIENNAFYALIQADWSLENEIIPYLRAVHVVSPL